MKMQSTINAARKILKNKEQNFDENTLVKLKEITDKAELIYNDVKIKRLKSRNAEQVMKELQNELDKFLESAESFKS